MKKDDFLLDDFLKQLKTSEELYSFLGKLQKWGLEKMLEGELDDNLVYVKHNKTSIPMP